MAYPHFHDMRLVSNWNEKRQEKKRKRKKHQRERREMQDTQIVYIKRNHIIMTLKRTKCTS